LRGIAVLLVIYEHYFVWCAPYAVLSAPKFLLDTTGTPTFGMTLFFTLSGFVIVYDYWDFGWRETPLASFGRFMFLRLSRLYPALLVFLALGFKRLTIEDSYFGPHWLLPTVANWSSLHTWYPLKFNGATVESVGYGINWSISTEIGMYLIFAAAMLGGRARPRVIAVMAAAYLMLIAVAFYLRGDVANAIAMLPPLYEDVDAAAAWHWFFYLSPYLRFGQFILGGAAAMVILRGRDDRLRPLLKFGAGLGALGLAWLYLQNLAGSPIHGDTAQIMQAVFFAAIMADARAPTLINRLLSKRSLIFFGLISYSLYLFQRLPADCRSETSHGHCSPASS
jgi:peptidoglycan/LPS O-acetylase OafA/YrhL